MIRIVIQFVIPIHGMTGSVVVYLRRVQVKQLDHFYDYGGKDSFLFPPRKKRDLGSHHLGIGCCVFPRVTTNGTVSNENLPVISSCT